jgi:hypothetical protein
MPRVGQYYIQKRNMLKRVTECKEKGICINCLKKKERPEIKHCDACSKRISERKKLKVTKTED